MTTTSKSFRVPDPEGSPIDSTATHDFLRRTPEGSPIDSARNAGTRSRTPEGSPIDSARNAGTRSRTPEGSPIDSARNAGTRSGPGGGHLSIAPQHAYVVATGIFGGRIQSRCALRSHHEDKEYSHAHHEHGGTPGHDSRIVIRRAVD